MFEKGGSANSDVFSGQPLFSNQKKKSEFAEPLFLNQISKNCRIKGWLAISNFNQQCFENFQQVTICEQILHYFFYLVLLLSFH